MWWLQVWVRGRNAVWAGKVKRILGGITPVFEEETGCLYWSISFAYRTRARQRQIKEIVRLPSANVIALLNYDHPED